MPVTRARIWLPAIAALLLGAGACPGQDLYDFDGDGVADGDDCAPEDPEIYPGNDETCDDNVDNDCDGDVDLADSDCAHDNDHDGWTIEQGDCDDHDETVNPGAEEVPCDTIDNDCDPTTVDDPDGDGDGYTVCTDCDDGEALVNQGMDEICGDGLDNDCDGTPNGCGWHGTFGLSVASAKLVGEGGWDRAGSAVAFAGDIDDDGVQDLLVGAPAYQSQGKAYLVDGPVAGTLDLAQAGASFLAANLSDWGGCALAGVGDVDGDGIDDLLIGAKGVDTGGDGGGAAYLFRGPVAGSYSLADADTVLVGAAGAEAGAAVAAAGDLDGDGHAELLVGAPGAEGDLGAVYLVRDPAAGTVELATADARIIGLHTFAGLGAAVQSAGDIDGDGEGDLLVSEPLHEAGTAYLLPGPFAGEIPLSSAQATVVLGAVKLGWALAAAGDVDGDGLDDVLVGGEASDTEPGGAFLLHGPLSGSLQLPGAAAAHLQPEADGDRAGLTLAGGGDVDGDGIPDLVIGAAGDPGVLVSPGMAYLFYGPVEGSLGVAAADAIFVGEADGDQAAEALAAGVDVDGDGYDDLLIGAPDHDHGHENAGAVYLIRGGPGI